MKLKGADIETISEDVFYDMFDVPTKEEKEVQKKHEEWLALGEEKMSWLVALRALAIRCGCKAKDLRYLEGIGYCELREYERLLRINLGKTACYAVLPDAYTGDADGFEITPAPKSYGVQRRAQLNRPDDLAKMENTMKALKAIADAEFEKVRRYIEPIEENPFYKALRTFPEDI